VADMLKLPQIALTPIIVGEDVIGMFTVLSRRLTDSDLPTITAFSSILAAGWRKTDLLAELRASVKELENTQSKLAQAQKMEAIGKLAGGVAHDFNNLLTVITGYTDILLGSVDDEGVRAHAEEVRNASQRAAELTQQLLAFSRQQPLEPRIIEGNSAVTSVSSLLRRLIGEDIALSVNLSPETGFIRVDPTQLEQVLMNLAVNARDAMPDGGALTIATDLAEVTVDEAREHDGVAPGTYMRLTVSDTGTGISKDSLDRLFEPFFSTKELGRGTGLGLSVVYGVVRQHGGFIEVDSELKKGTTFRVYLPSAAPESSEKHGAPKESAPPTGSGQRILLVEDDETVRIVTSQMLELSGYEVTAVEDTTQALAALDTSSPFDLVFTDIVLPDRSGVWLAEHLAETRPDVRILVGTGYTDDRSRGQVVTDLGLDFIRKPYEAGELMRTVHGVLARPN